MKKFKCDNCDEKFDIKYKREACGNIVCNDCFDNDYFKCRDCGNTFWSSHEFGDSLCEDCGAECDNCNRCKSKKEMEDDGDGIYICKDCIKESNRLYIKVREHSNSTDIERTKELIME